MQAKSIDDLYFALKHERGSGQVESIPIATLSSRAGRVRLPGHLTAERNSAEDLPVAVLPAIDWRDGVTTARQNLSSISVRCITYGCDLRQAQKVLLRTV